MKRAVEAIANRNQSEFQIDVDAADCQYNNGTAAESTTLHASARVKP